MAAPDDLGAAVEGLVGSIVSKPRAPVAMGKAFFYRQLEAGTEPAYKGAASTMAYNMMQATALEGVQAFVDKRAPQW